MRAQEFTHRTAETNINGDRQQEVVRVNASHVSLEESYNFGLDLTSIGCRNPTLAKCGGEAQHSWQFDSRPLKVGNRPCSNLRIENAICRWKDLDEGYKFGLDLVAIRLGSREL